jgi:hypothetical protein
LPGSGVVGYFTTHLVNSSSKFHFAKSAISLDVLTTKGISNHKDEIIILFVGGNVLNLNG